MKIKNTILLAKTKFRIRRPRLIAGIIVLGLAFGITGTICTLLINLSQQLTPFQSYGINNKYLVEARNMQFSVSSNEKQLIKRALEIYEEKLANNEYDEASIPLEYPVEKFADGSEELKINTAAASAAIIEIAKNQNNYKLTDAQKLADSANAQKLYHYSANLQTTNDGAITSIRNDTENYKTLINNSEYDLIATYFGSPIYAIEDEIYSLYQLPDETANDDEIPVYVSSKLATDIDSKIIEVCYRNSDSVEYISNALIDEVDFQLPTTACAQPDYQDASAERVKFHIVGIFPSYDYVDNSNTLVSLIQNIANSGLPDGVIIPKQQLTKGQQQYVDRYFTYTDDLLSNYMYNKDTFIFEFANASDARHFIDSSDCSTPICSADKPFALTEFANSAILAADISDKVTWIIFALIGVCIASCIVILATTINRLISDSRKENAILAAIGYSNRNIQSIYLAFATMYACFIFCISATIIIIVPLVFQAIFGAQISQAFINLFHTPVNYSINLCMPNIAILATAICLFVICILTTLATTKSLSDPNIAKRLREE